MYICTLVYVLTLKFLHILQKILLLYLWEIYQNCSTQLSFDCSLTFNMYKPTVIITDKYSGQKPLFLPHPQNLELLFLPHFFFFLKICNRCHQHHHFHFSFCGVLNFEVLGMMFFLLSYGWGEMNFCQKLGKRGVQYYTFLMQNGVKRF